MHPKFSLIVATLGRKEELTKLLDSLVSQTFGSFEVIIVDQNPEGFLAEVLQRYESSLRLVYLRSAKGLSRARNVGIKSAVGEYVAFPDDDCWYSPDTLELVTKLLQNDALKGVTGNVIDGTGRPTMGRWPVERQTITKVNIFETAISFTIFLRRKVVDDVGGFDEALGVGSGTLWGSGEETDFLLRALQYGQFEYFPSLKIFHPEKVVGDAESLNRAFLYGAGLGRVLRKHHFNYMTSCYFLGRPMVGALVYLVRGNTRLSKFHLRSALGRIRGYLG